MALVKGITRKSTEAWKSPDGQRTIYEVVLEVEGEPFKTQTFSEKIAQEGFEGELEVYEKNGKQFVRQAPKEDSQYGGRSGGAYSGGKSFTPKDQFTMYLSYAKDLMVACIARGDKITFEEAVSQTIGAGHTLYDDRPDAVASTVASIASGETKIDDISESDFSKLLDDAVDKNKDKFDI